MGPDGSLLHLQVPTTCPYSEPEQSSPCPSQPTSWRSILILSSHLWMSLPSDLFPSCLPTKSLYIPHLSSIHATCRAHLILLDLITRIVFGEEYRSFGSSLYSFIHSPVTPSLLGPNIFLNALFSNTLSLRSSLDVSDQESHPPPAITLRNSVFCSRDCIYVLLLVQL